MRTAANVEDVRSLLQSALDWLVENARFFTVPDELREVEVDDVVQRLTELAVAIRVLEARGGAPRRDLAPLTLLLKGALAREDLVHRLLRSPVHLPLIGYLLAALPDARSDWHALLRQVQERVDYGFLEQDERLPFRTMDVAYALESAGLRHQLSDWQTLNDSSVLSHDLRIPVIDRSTAYAVTHAVFFSTGFGARGGASHALITNPELPQLLTSLIVCMSLEDDWDLLGELLLSWECLHLPPSDITRLAWRDLWDAQQEDGSFPGPSRLIAVSDQGVNNDAWTKFARSYHTTLVAIMAMSLLLEADGTRPKHGSRRPCAGHSASRNASANAGLANTLPSVALNAQSWFAAVSESLDLALVGGQRLLIGSWICDEILRLTQQGPTDVTAMIAEALSSGTGKAQPQTPTGALQLVASVIMASYGDRTSEVETAVRAFSMLHSPRRAPSVLSVERLEVRSPTSLNSTRALIGDVLEASAAGLYDVRLRYPVPGLIDWLQGYMFQCLRDYDLMCAADSLRALCYLGARGRKNLDASEYLVLQQTPSGDFGLTAPEEIYLAPLVGETGPLEAYKLPVTVECVWSIAEANLPWRLSRAVARISAKLEPG